jgi:PRTRC genetic system protein C
MSDNRVFKYHDQTWEGPGEEYTNEDVRRHLQTYFPELAQADIQEKTLDDGTVEVTFVKRAGTKG